jgi:hypothetical protein
VTTGGSQFQGPFDILLSLDIGEVHGIVVLLIREELAGRNHHRLEGLILEEEVHGLIEVVDAIDLEVIDDGGLAGVGFGENDAFVFLLAGLDGHRQAALYGSQASVEG